MSWSEISSRRQSTMMDDWTEFLCVRSSRRGRGWEIAVCGVARNGRLVPMTDDSMRRIDTLSADTIREALASFDWTQAEDLANIERIARQA